MNPPRALSILIFGLAALVLAACGQEEGPPGGALERSGAPERSRAQLEAARRLRQGTGALVGDLTDNGRNLAEGPRARRRVVRRLGPQERRARRLAGRARKELRAGDPDRPVLAMLNERLARVASRLRELARSPDAAARTHARIELEAAAEGARRLHGQSAGGSPAGLDRSLEDLSRTVGEIRVP